MYVEKVARVCCPTCGREALTDPHSHSAETLLSLTLGISDTHNEGVGESSYRKP
ncbi:hypothetical protein GMOD_00006978 [Pyrenophora seminiperda CCB06]|uniref:Uncharacterized protein n=1 Tax=Pyrenophora seminiperda CCB06 TaxID=1302712 RepID=A0A3M7MBV5_9PLEO|nr:hypothetical protein GMOD_00006978 [Pyrenophora seminiperda CCB06]